MNERQLTIVKDSFELLDMRAVPGKSVDAFNLKTVHLDSCAALKYDIRDSSLIALEQELERLAEDWSA